jgi:peptide/nickel transport system permease protein
VGFVGLPYVIRRSIVYFLSLFGGLLINFLAPRLVPGNPLQTRLMELQRMGVRAGGQEFIEKYMKIFGLDQPLHVQFINYLSSVIHGNLGVSITRFPTEVREVIALHFPWTLGLLYFSYFACFFLGVLLGALVGWKSSKMRNAVFMLFIVLSQMQYYTVAMSLLYLFAFLFPVFPTGSAYSLGITFESIFHQIVDIAWHAVLPALSIILIGVGGWTLAARGLMVSIKGEDYLMLAKAKGLSERRRFLYYGLKNTLLPQITDLAITMGFVATGSILVEVIFRYPGMGYVLYRAITALDYPLIQGIALMYVFGVTTAGFIVDLMYPLIDPRVRHE